MNGDKQHINHEQSLLYKSANSLSKITRELQEVTMAIRMVPLDGLFNKMTRLVRDLSIKSAKDIKLHISGEDTEMDRNVIEQISDPLLHILRNSIDHGIEPTDIRISKKKTNFGNIYLSAKHEGNEIWISVKDDGSGLNREKIIKKAVENGLLKGNIEEIKDEEIWQLIFNAGFSTADKLSEISGRGVGMDVVKKNIEKLKGRVDIHSEYENGSEIILKIPLTMAVIDGITVKVGNNLYSIPNTDILEFFKVKPEQIFTIENGNLVIKLRESIIPVLKLYKVFKKETNITELTDGVIILLHGSGKKVCVLVDEIRGNQQIVIKSISEYLGKLNGISGCAILGNGDVSLIIDTSGLINEYIK